MEYWVYEDRIVNYAKVHEGDCFSCNHGQGMHGLGDANRKDDQWIGPFGDKGAAQAAAEKTGRRDITGCGRCGT